ncbi:unnamed protein product [Thlaspi arvense]|uniref:Uncharacterized protein n=1 Tax=Thlaspi arvense TaxID=13288 RepID=A0AAU9R962_THLAR|nr:unnamed protein product [Thlaspi arvense]
MTTVPLHSRTCEDWERNRRTTGVEIDGDQHVHLSSEARDFVLQRVLYCEVCRAMAASPTRKHVSSD